jgi:hypothetical protein
MSTSPSPCKNVQLLKSLQFIQFDSTTKFARVYNRVLVLLSLKTLFFKK